MVVFQSITNFKNMRQACVTLLLMLIPLSCIPCHLVTISETSAVDNGDGTFTYTFNICVGTENTYGFYLSFSGANLTDYEPFFTSGSLSTTITPSVPPISGSGDIEYGDWDNSSAPLFSGGTNDCMIGTFTFDGPITNVSIDGTQPFYSGGPCSGASTTTSCFTSVAEYVLEINSDDYGSDISWDLEDQSNNSVVESGSGYSSNTTYTIPMCVSEGCYDFNIYDSYGDGICCSEGNGSYTLTHISGTVVASGGDYGSGETTNVGCTDLPVDLLDFKAQRDGAINEIEWSVASQVNNDYFVLEHSTDGKNWQVLETIDGAGNTTSQMDYSFHHSFEKYGINYYRLTQFDFDGASETFPIVSVNDSEGSKRTIIRHVNTIGQTVSDDYKGIVFIQFSDGTTKKIMNR